MNNRQLESESFQSQSRHLISRMNIYAKEEKSLEILIFQTLFPSLDCVFKLKNSLATPLLYLNIRKTQPSASNLLLLSSSRKNTSFKHRTRILFPFLSQLDSHSRSLKEGNLSPLICLRVRVLPKRRTKRDSLSSYRRGDPLNSSLKHFSGNLSPPRWFPPTRKLVSFQHGQKEVADPTIYGQRFSRS